MQLKYKLLDIDRGVLITRQPALVQDEIEIHFDGVPTGKAVAVFVPKTTVGEPYYRDLVNGSCILPSDLDGEIMVTVTMIDYTTVSAPTWVCEGLKIEKSESGCLIAPNDMNLPYKVVDLELDNEKLRASIKSLTESVSALEQRLTDIMEGYDIA